MSQSVLHCLNVCVHVCVPHSPIFLGVHMYVEACGDIGQPFFFVLGTQFIIVLELTKWARQAGQKAPGVHLSLPNQCWYYRFTRPNQTFYGW